jgi:hypothetical protein
MGKIVPLDERFWSKVDASGDCWEWTAAKNPSGYGVIMIRSRRKAPYRAHRVAWELLVGEISDGLQLDHLCRNRACVNPDHLEPVTNAENGYRGSGKAGRSYVRPTRCKHDHVFDEVNTYTYRGVRHCRQCVRDRGASYRQRLKVNS